DDAVPRVQQVDGLLGGLELLELRCPRERHVHEGHLVFDAALHRLEGLLAPRGQRDLPITPHVGLVASPLQIEQEETRHPRKGCEIQHGAASYSLSRQGWTRLTSVGLAGGGKSSSSRQ